MKIYKTEIAALNNFLVSVVNRNLPYFNAPYHVHPEVELVYILEGFGNRIIGDKIEPFEAGDMVFIGSNLPHVWLNDTIFYKGDAALNAKAIVLYFNTKILGNSLFHLNEFTKIGKLLKEGERGLKITGETNKLVAARLEQLLFQIGTAKVIGLFELCELLANSNDLQYITSDGYRTSNKNIHTDRISAILHYIQQNYQTSLTLSTIADVAHLTPKSFCRMFKKKTNKHFIEYLNEVRISNACNFLINTDWSVAEIAFKCGFKTVSNFNKLFRDAVGICPTEYRDKTNFGR
jgi:AraC-like DNA-binding protein